MTTSDNELLIYQAENGAIALKADAKLETVWASQKEMAQILCYATKHHASP